MSPNDKRSCGYKHLKNLLEEISEEVDFNLFHTDFTFPQLQHFPHWFYFKSLCFSPHSHITNSLRNMSGLYFGKINPELRTTGEFWAMARHWVVICCARRLMGWLCVGMEQPVERLELERARFSINQTVKEVHLSKIEKKMCVVSHGWFYCYCFLLRKWPLALKIRHHIFL